MQTTEMTIVASAWAALGRNDLDTLREVLSVNARWRAITDTEFSREGRNEILAMIDRHQGAGLRRRGVRWQGIRGLNLALGQKRERLDSREQSSTRSPFRHQH